MIEQGAVQELHIERTSSRGIVGNIYNGRVIRVLPGMQSAFVDIGLDRAAFLHLADIWRLRQGEDAGKPIERLLHEGKNIVVQVIKDANWHKGRASLYSSQYRGAHARLSSAGIAYRYFQRIEDETERKSLREKLRHLVPAGEKAVFIIRTMAEAMSDRICRPI